MCIHLDTSLTVSVQIMCETQCIRVHYAFTYEWISRHKDRRLP